MPHVIETALRACFLHRGAVVGTLAVIAELHIADLVERVTAQIARTAGPMISKKDCARVVDSFLDAIKEALQEQKNIEVRGFGTFKIRHRKTRMARNPRTGSPVEVSARPVPVFKPSKELRAMVAGLEVEEEDEDEKELSNA